MAACGLRTFSGRASRGFSGRQSREAQVLATFQLCHVDDLPGVVAEMFVDVGDGDEARNTITLNIKLTRERLGGEPADRLACFLHGFLQSPDKQPARDRTTLGKFLVSLAAVGRPDQSGDDPLADVTAEVQ